jgi:anti-sigma B factor antagonist
MWLGSQLPEARTASRVLLCPGDAKVDDVRSPSPAGDAQPSLAVRMTPGPGPGQIVVSVVGDIDLNTETQLREALARLESEPAQRVVLDLSGVEFMASAGIHVLLNVNAALRSEGRTLVVACPQLGVARILTLTGADQLVPIAETVADALAL